MSHGAPTASGAGGAAGRAGLPEPSAVAEPDLPAATANRVIAGLVITGFLLSAAVLAVEFETGLGVQVTLLAALFAALPLLVVVPTYLWLDRYEVEPAWLLVLAFAWGAICAPAGALFLNTGIADRHADGRGGGPRRRHGGLRSTARRGGPQGVRGPADRAAAAARVRRGRRRHRVCGPGGRRVRLQREHPVPRPRVRGVRPAGAHRAVHPALHHGAVRAPAVHGVHRDRARARGGGDAQRLEPGTRRARRLPPRALCSTASGTCPRPPVT